MSVVRKIAGDSNPQKGAYDLTIVMLGSGGCGAKSALTIKYVEGRFVEAYDPTIEDVYGAVVSIDGHELKVNIIDTCGQMNCSDLSESYFGVADVAIVGFDITSRCSFEAANDYVNSFRSKSATHGMIVAVGNKIDLEDSRQVSKKEAEEFFGSMKPPIPFIETSARTGENVNEVFETAIRMWCASDDRKKCVIC